MKVYIKDFPPKFSYDLTLLVYTLDPDIFGGTEDITVRDIKIQKE